MGSQEWVSLEQEGMQACFDFKRQDMFIPHDRDAGTLLSSLEINQSHPLSTKVQRPLAQKDGAGTYGG